MYFFHNFNSSLPELFEALGSRLPESFPRSFQDGGIPDIFLYLTGSLLDHFLDLNIAYLDLDLELQLTWIFSWT